MAPYQKLSDYEEINSAPHVNAGLDDPEFRNFTGIYSDAIFEVFYQFARANMPKGLPLVIAGGCGLNCDWNSKWAETGIFSDVFVPPVANDSGSAIGTAIDAQLHFTNNPKLDWEVYSGLPFQERGSIDESKYDIYEPNFKQTADFLANGLIMAWVSGKYEIGPRALGNRSILAAPFRDATKVILNEIKQREQFRPIAPACLREDAKVSFGCNHNSPHMLYTFRTHTDALPAVTHVNGTARVQTVTPDDNETLHDLLAAFKQRTGYGVLCNTSLNFNGKGFINNIVDLDAYASQHGLDGFVVEGRAYLMKSSKLYQEYRRSSAKPSRHKSLQPSMGLASMSIHKGRRLLTDCLPDFENDEQLRSAFVRELTLLQLKSTDDSVDNGNISARSIPRTLIRYWHDFNELPEDVKECLDSWNRLEREGFEIRTFNDLSAKAYIADKFSFP